LNHSITQVDLQLLQENDATLFTKVKGNDQLAFEVLFKKYYQSLCSYAFQFMEEDLGSEEIVQDVFCSIWEQRETAEIESFKSYCYRAVRNKCLNAIKHIKVREEYKAHNQYQQDLEQGNFDEEGPVNELSENIEAVIEAMPDMRKKVFKMSRYDGLKYREIAEKLGISIKTVEIHMSKALAYLRVELAQYVTLMLALIHFYFNNK